MITLGPTILQSPKPTGKAYPCKGEGTLVDHGWAYVNGLIWV
jgi:hypothetical protein